MDQLSPKQRATIKEMVLPPSDPELLAYMKKHTHTFIQCPNKFCSIFFEKVSSSSADHGFVLVRRYLLLRIVLLTDMMTQDEAGVPLRGDSLVHFQNFRFKCYNCEISFCDQCGVIPYHLGETCEQVLTD